MKIPTDHIVPGPRFDEAAAYHVNAAFFDIDNTLVPNGDSGLPPREFIRAARTAGDIALLGVATARPLAKARHIIEEAEMAGLSILSNGAQIYDGVKGTMLHEYALPDGITADITRTLRASRVEHWVQDDGVDHFWEPGNQTERSARSRNGGLYVRSRDIWLPPEGDNRQEVAGYTPQKPLVVVAHNVSRPDANLMHIISESYGGKVAAITAHEALQPDGTALYDIFFLDHRSNKKAALQTAAHYTGIALGNTLFAGDGPNDIVGMQHAGTAVAVGNAVQSTLEAATHIAPRFDRHGVAVAIRELITPA